MSEDQHVDVMELLGNSFDQGGLLVFEKDLGESFFDLSTGIAGELFQKFTNYNQKLAIVVADLSIYSDRLQELALEHSKHSHIRFVTTAKSGREWLNQQE